MHAPDIPHDLKVTKQLDGSPETRSRTDFIMLLIANFSEEELTLPKGTVLGIAQEISENLVVSVSDEEDADRGTEQTFLEAIRRYLRSLGSI
jgi:hypothetical protein